MSVVAGPGRFPLPVMRKSFLICCRGSALSCAAIVVALLGIGSQKLRA